jgi:hypothetical protein
MFPKIIICGCAQEPCQTGKFFRVLANAPRYGKPFRVILVVDNFQNKNCIFTAIFILWKTENPSTAKKCSRKIKTRQEV